MPGIKSEAAYLQAGSLDLGELQLDMLEKIEELTLYVIALQEKIEQLEKARDCQEENQVQPTQKHADEK